MDEIMLSSGRVEAGWWGPPPDRMPTLVLLHEGLGCVALWRDFPGQLQALTGCGVLAYSRFGYGGSDPASLPRPMSYMHDEATQVLPDVLNRVGIERAITIGHSDGGSIAAIHAGATHDPRLLGVVMMAAHFFVEDMNLAVISDIRTTYAMGDLRRRLGRYHRDPDNAFHGWSDAWLDPRFRAFDIISILGRIQVPVLALQGRDDPYGTSEQLRVLEDCRSGDTIVRLIPDARHSPHLDAPAMTLAITTEFIKGRLA